MSKLTTHRGFNIFDKFGSLDPSVRFVATRQGPLFTVRLTSHSYMGIINAVNNHLLEVSEFRTESPTEETE